MDQVECAVCGRVRPDMVGSGWYRQGDDWFCFAHPPGMVQEPLFSTPGGNDP